LKLLQSISSISTTRNPKARVRQFIIRSL
jgi:hypothetical protein